VGAKRVVVVSDSHLTARLAATGRNWDAVLRHVENVRPDLLLHLGDLCMNGTHDEDDLEYGRARMDEVPVPWRTVPGNHDIGDTVSAAIDPGEVVTTERVTRWRERFGPDWWAADLGGWRVIGVDAQLFDTGLSDEAEQWDFIEAELGPHAPAGRRRLLVTHKPLAASDAELASAPGYRFVSSPARERLWAQARDASVAAVLSGHVHQARALVVDGVTQLWAPTTWAVLPGAVQATIGSKRCGVMELELPDEGPVGHRTAEPDGITQLVIPENRPYPPSD
jgi:3',5'-cyclic AMP phosphodiesterase CpdA